MMGPGFSPASTVLSVSVLCACASVPSPRVYKCEASGGQAATE